MAGAVHRARDTADVAEGVREAAARGDGLRIAAARTWLDAGRPVSARATLAVDALEGIVDYTPGDLTLTARAATSLDAIARATSAERQWLALDPPGAATGTLGATVATASAGPLACAFGTPRDNVLGLEAVTGDGKVVRAGGRVVKNVAGFDLARLFTGAWGTLAIITEVSIRLRALPDADTTVALAVPVDHAALDAMLGRLRAMPLAPLALELVTGALASRLGLGARDTLLARVAGNARAVAAQRDALARLAPLDDAPPDVWTALGAAEPAGAAVVRLSRAPSHLAGVWDAARRAADDLPGTLVHAAVTRGVVRCILPRAGDDVLARTLERWRAAGATLIAERLPAAGWAALPAELPNAALARAAQHAFDPAGILNPGILGAAS